MAFLKKKEKKESKKQKKSTSGNRKENEQKRTVQNAISYQMMLRDGCCLLGEDLYSASFKFNDINYQIATDEEKGSIFERYRALLNALGNEYGLQLTINNRIIDQNDFLNNVSMNLQGDDADKYRKEMNRIVEDKVKYGNSHIISDKILTFTVKEKSVVDARKSLKYMESEYKKRFLDLKCETEVMDGYKRLETIHSIFEPEKPFCFNYDMLDSSYTTKDAIAPDCLDFKTYGNSTFLAGNRFCKVLYIKSWNSMINDQIIHNLSRLENNLTISFHMRAIPRGEDLALVKSQRAMMEMQKEEEQQKAIRRNYDPDMIPMELKKSMLEAEMLENKIETLNERLFECQFLIMINEPSLEKLNETKKAVENACDINCQLGELAFRQEEAMNAVLPIGVPVKGLVRTLNTAVCAYVMPFTSQELMQKHRTIYYGVNTLTNNVITANRRLLDNPSGWIFGMPGYGKSMAAKNELSWVYLGSKDYVIVIDPQAEFVPLAEEYGGEVINVDTQSNMHFNPYLGNYYDRNFVKEKCEFSQIFIAGIMEKDFLDAKEKAIVDICTRKMFEESNLKEILINKDETMELNASLDDLYRCLKERTEEEAENIALALELYISGATYDIFAGKNNVNINSRFTIFNILNLPATLRSLGMKVILETLRTKILENRKKGIRTWIYIDEIYTLLKDKYSENFLYEFFKWVRKFGGIPTGITQNVEDLLNSPQARTMLSNSEFVLMVNQSNSDRIELQDILDLSDDQMKYITDAPKGTGILKFGRTIIPFSNEIPDKTNVYYLWNTTFGEHSGFHDYIK